MQDHFYLGLALVLALLLGSCQAEPEGRDYAADIAYMEQNLVPAIVIEGEEGQRYTLAERMDDLRVPAISMAFFEDGEIKWARAYGQRRAGAEASVDTATLFQAASISKPIAATAMLQLVEEGRLDLDADVNTYLTSWKVEENAFTATEKVTLRRLVSHSAGLTVSGFPGYAATDSLPTTVQVLEGSPPANTAKIRPDTVPGTRWRYSGGGYTVMQRVLEETLDQPFPAILAERVLDPLGMARSTYAQPLPTDQWTNWAAAHDTEGQPVAGDFHSYPEMAAAGLWTTPSDLARWAIAIQNAYHGSDESLLEQETARAMLTRQFDDYGLGPGLSGSADSLRFSHGGSNRGFRCYLFAFARPGGPGFAVMTNASLGFDLGMSVLRGLSDHYGWDAFQPEVRQVIDLPADSLPQYTGTYRFGPDLDAVLEVRDDTLRFALQWNDYSSYLLPEASDRFFDPTDGTTVTFLRDADGQVEAMIGDGDRAERVQE